MPYPYTYTHQSLRYLFVMYDRGFSNIKYHFLDKLRFSLYESEAFITSRVLKLDEKQNVGTKEFEKIYVKNALHRTINAQICLHGRAKR